MNGKILFICLLGAAWSATGSDLYVDAAAATGGNGSSSTPYASIQDAIEGAVAGDTIYVRPGVYDQGAKSYSNVKNGTNYTLRARVFIDKNDLRIVSTGGRDVTHIVGELGAGLTDQDGSSGGVACVYVSGERRAVVEGFTMRNGMACKLSSRSGGISASSNNWTTNMYTCAYCTISNCVGAIGAIYGGVSVGVLARGTAASSYGAVYWATLYNCIISDSSAGSYGIINSGRIINTTVVNNLCAGPASVNVNNSKGEGGKYYNCAFFGCKSILNDRYGVYSNAFVDATSYSNASVNVSVHASKTYYTNVCMSAVTGDYRPIAGGELDGKGNPDFLDFDNIPAEYRWRDFQGTTISDHSKVPLGALLPTAVPATVGACGTTLNFKFNGHPAATSYHVYNTDKWPAQVFVEPPDNMTNTTLAISVNKYAGESSCYNYFLGRQSGAWITLPRAGLIGQDGLPATAVPVYYQSADKLLYVDCNLDDYTGHDGSSWEKAFKTLQEAVSAAKVAKKNTRVFVKGGVYDEGYAEDDKAPGVYARVVVPSDYPKILLFDAVDGRENTFLVGAPDPDTLTDANYPGIGPKALRCLIHRSSSSVAFAGFAFTNGYANTTSSTTNLAYSGAAFLSSVTQLADCRIVDCHAVYAGAVYGGRIYRSLIEQSGGRYGTMRNCVLTACILRNNRRALGADNDVLYESCTAVNCTFDDLPSASLADTIFSGAYNSLVNCVVVSGGKVLAVKSGYACSGVYADSKCIRLYDAATADRIQFLPTLVSRVDYSPVSTSPVLGGGALGDVWREAAACTYQVGDFNNHTTIHTNGLFTAGAIASWRECRKHYVSPSGDDANDGFTEATAKQTLQAAVDDPLYVPGEEIIALPGVYNLGSGIHTLRVTTSTPSNITIRARVHVTPGTILRSRDGAETTIIEGAAATINPDAWGRGKDAIRGVMVENGGYVQGFTIRNGRCLDCDTGYFDDKYSGGVLGRNTLSVVEDCIISNNFSSCGGGSSLATLRRCRIVNNWAKHFAGAVRSGSLYNCYIAGNSGPRVSECLSDCVNCTYGVNYAKDGTSATLYFENMSGCANLANVVVASAKVSSGNFVNAKRVRNCIFPKEMKFGSTSSSGWGTNPDVSGVITNYTGTQLAAMFRNGYPIGTTNIAVDAGFDLAAAGDLDLACTARVKNGAIDLGCYEYDWCGDYGAMLGATVTAANAGVVAQDGAVTLGDGATLAATWNVSAKPGSTTEAYNTVHTVAATLSGAGTLNVYLNGALLGTLSGTGALTFRNAFLANNLTFDYVGEGSATLAKLTRLVGSTILFR